MKVHNENWAIGKPFASIQNQRDSQGEILWKHGSYNFKNGSVLIYQEPKLLSLSLYLNGRGYYRTIRGKTFTDIGIARKAGEFAKEILSGCSVPQGDEP